MTTRIPKWKCRRCTHYRTPYCTLHDLEPCAFTYKSDEKARDKFLAFVTALGIVLITLILIFL